MNTELTEKGKHAICLAAIEVKKEIEWKFITLGGMLHKIKKERLFEAGWNSWDDYQLDLKLSRASISRLLGIYEVFVLHYQFKPKELADAGGWSQISDLLPLIDQETTSKARVEELLRIVATQTREDARKSLQDVRRGKSCEHKVTHDITLRICDGPNCSERWRVE